MGPTGLIKNKPNHNNKNNPNGYLPQKPPRQNPFPHLHPVYRRHLLGDKGRQSLVGQLPRQEGPRVDVLLDATAGEQAEQSRAEAALRQQREDDAVRYQGLDAAFAVSVAVDSEEDLFRLGVRFFVLEEVVREGDLVEEVREASAGRVLFLFCSECSFDE